MGVTAMKINSACFMHFLLTPIGPRVWLVGLLDLFLVLILYYSILSVCSAILTDVAKSFSMWAYENEQ